MLTNKYFVRTGNELIIPVNAPPHPNPPLLAPFDIMSCYANALQQVKRTPVETENAEVCFFTSPPWWSFKRPQLKFKFSVIWLGFVTNLQPQVLTAPWWWKYQTHQKEAKQTSLTSVSFNKKISISLGKWVRLYSFYGYIYRVTNVPS